MTAKTTKINTQRNILLLHTCIYIYTHTHIYIFQFSLSDAYPIRIRGKALSDQQIHSLNKHTKRNASDRDDKRGKFILTMIRRNVHLRLLPALETNRYNYKYHLRLLPALETNRYNYKYLRLLPALETNRYNYKYLRLLPALETNRYNYKYLENV